VYPAAGLSPALVLHRAQHFLAGCAGKISEYAIRNARPELRNRLQICNATSLPFADDTFDLVISITALHNAYCYDFDRALREVERVGRRNKYICIESYRNEQEKTNLLYWQVTCEMFCTPKEWDW
jgi:ubiquinone/menaquinone biosynthesis C-methylase UbiE